MTQLIPILNFWPMVEYEPRPNQIKALEWLEQQTAKHCILQAPIGVGKSLCALTYSRWLNQGKGDSFILTTQRALQAQYVKEFKGKDLDSIYGRANYECPQFNTTCNIGKLLKKCSGHCTFTKALQHAQSSSNLVMNYAHAFLIFNYLSDMFNDRTLMVFDEAHNLESHLVTHQAASISRLRSEKLKVKFLETKDIKKAFEWLTKKYYPAAVNEYAKLKIKAKDIGDRKEEPNTDELKLLRELERTEGHVSGIDDFLQHNSDSYSDNFVLVSDNKNLMFKPIYGAKNFHRWCVPKAERFLYMSSTIINPYAFADDLGLDSEDVAYLSLDSDFPKENRKVVYIEKQMKMNAKWNNPENEKGRKEHIDLIKVILNNHKGESGIIHTGNFKIAEWLVEELSDVKNLNIYNHNPSTEDSRDSVISAYINDPKPSLLISPSITEGLDLKENLGRFAIFSKIPFKYLGDTWIKKRMELSNEWYQRMAIMDMIQGGGRIVRSKEDKGDTYIIDGSWAYFYYNNNSLFPDWWKEAYYSL